jgi:hypothetical protein
MRHKTLGQRARQVVSLLRRWQLAAPIKLLGDQAYSILELGLHCTHEHITLIAPFRLDSVLHQPAPGRTPHPIGRPRVVGARLPSLEHILQDPQTVWQRLTLDWYAEGKRTLELCTGTPAGIALGRLNCLSAGCSPAVRQENDRPRRSFPPIRPSLLKRWCAMRMKRWSLEATFEESRAHLGVETQRQWSDREIERTTPLLFGLYSLVALFGAALAPDGHPPLKRASWYHKSAATFSDILALVRRQLWGNFVFPTSPLDPNVVLLPRATLAQLAHAACY